MLTDDQVQDRQRAELRELKAQRDELLTALRPFAALDTEYMREHRGAPDLWTRFDIPHAQILAARAALTRAGKEGAK